MRYANTLANALGLRWLSGNVYIYQCGVRRSEHFETLNVIPFRAGNIVYMSNEPEKHNFQCIGPHIGMPI